MAKRIRKKIRKGISLGIKVVKVGTHEFERGLKKALSGKKIDKKYARKILSAMLREAKISSRNFAAFAKQETKRVSNKLKPMMKKAVKKAKVEVKKRLSKRGARRRRR